MKNQRKTLAVLTAAALFSVSLFALSGCVSDGRDGADGKDFNLYQTYQQLVEMEQFSGTYEQFVKQYLSVDITETENSFSSAINTTLSSIVSVWVGCDYSYRSGFVTSTTTFYAAGSGIIYSLDKEAGDAYIITNCHVVYDSFDSTVREDGVTYTRVSSATGLDYNVFLYGMEYNGSETIKDYPDYSIPFTIVGYSMENDIAVLKVENSEILKNSLAQAVTVADSDEIFIGDDVFALGNPLGEGIAASEGIVSKENEVIEVYGADQKTLIYPRAICTSATINEGNSGGGLFNKEGELIGIVFAKNVEDYVESMSYALPANNVIGVADSIIANCRGSAVTTKKAQLGITSYVIKAEQVFNADANRITTKKTIAVQSVSLGSAASGNLKSGDILQTVTLKGETLVITKDWQLSEFLWKVREGDTISLTVLRNNETVSMDITFRSSNFISVG